MTPVEGHLERLANRSVEQTSGLDLGESPAGLSLDVGDRVRAASSRLSAPSTSARRMAMTRTERRRLDLPNPSSPLERRKSATSEGVSFESRFLPSAGTMWTRTAHS